MSKLKYVVPNLFTVTSLGLGLASVTRSADGDYRLAAWMILWGVLLDKLDGTAARLLHAESKVGGELDSFADFTVFGIAPAALLFFRLRETASYEGATLPLLAGACALHAMATAGRLARFNISSPPQGDRLFYGIPGTLMGAILASSYLTWDKHGANEQLLIFSPAVLVVGAVLMISTIRLPKLKARKSKLINLFQGANVAAAYVLAPLMLLPEYLMTLALSYTVGGILWCWAYPPRGEPQRISRPPAPAG
ncbi:MAG: CDP-alcohol phosphatidyltransferase family protein [Deltaproteobacteria bacterium]|jgi:CDP-diacylglycerol--serine O-phosphatidyltransferase|nr:CDP-alcohol phosphatidyltransferase family protein [Deltaproteobacteria bacterium]